MVANLVCRDLIDGYARFDVSARGFAWMHAGQKRRGRAGVGSAAIAEFKDNLRDWSDVAAEVTESERLEAAGQLLTQIKAIERRGYHAAAGVANRYVRTSRFEMAVVVFFGAPFGETFTNESEVWLQKTMSMA